MAGEIDLAKLYHSNTLLNSKHAQNYYNQQISIANSTAKQDFGFDTNKDEKVDWAKFAMWLRGFLAAIEGQPLTPDSVSKIMDKLAYVDPDKKLSYGQSDPFDFLKNLPPQSPHQHPLTYPPLGGPVTVQPWVKPNTTGSWQGAQLEDQWTIYNDHAKNTLTNIHNANVRINNSTKPNTKLVTAATTA